MNIGLGELQGLDHVCGSEKTDNFTWKILENLEGLNCLSWDDIGDGRCSLNMYVCRKGFIGNWKDCRRMGLFFMGWD